MSKVIDDMDTLMNPIKPKTDSVLMSMKKDELIKYIRVLEHNYNVAISFNEQQARNIEQLMKDAGKVSATEILALKAVVRGCENNTKLLTSTYVDKNEQRIVIEKAIGVVRRLIVRLGGAV